MRLLLRVQYADILSSSSFHMGATTNSRERSVATRGGFRGSMLWLSGALLVLQLVSAVPQVHYSGNAIARSQQDQTISPDAVTVTLASLLSVKAPFSVSSDVSRQVRNGIFGLKGASWAFDGTVDHN